MIRFSASKAPSAATKKKTEKALIKLLKRKDLGFHQLPFRDENWLSSEKLGQELAHRGDDLVVLGMGGSALGGRCLVNSLGNSEHTHFLFNTDPISFEAVIGNRQRLRESQFLLISKSGNTLELHCMIDALQSRLQASGRELSSAVSVITEPKPNPLRNWAEKNRLLIADHPTDVGGRFSVLSPVGLAPAQFAGVNLAELREGAKLAVERPEVVLDLAAYYYESFKRKEHVSAFWIYADAISSFGPWLSQLWAESLGKKAKGLSASTPLALYGTCDQHSALQQLMGDALKRSICFVRSKEHEQMGPELSGVGLEGFTYLKQKNLGHVFATQSRSTEEALKKSGKSTLSLEIDHVSAKSLGQLLVSFELVIGVLGEMMNINAFDQPGVELGKKITKKKLEKR